MKQYHRRSLLVAAVASVSVGAAASAQELVTFGAAEVGGFGSSLVLLGASLSPAGMGWKPVGTVMGYHAEFRGGSTNVFAPSVGLLKQSATGAWQGRVGYSFVSDETSVFNPTTGTSTATAGENGVFAVLQGDYWGTGANSAQFIGSYNFADEFLWARVRGAQRMGATTSRIMLGAEAGVLGTSKGSGSWGLFLGPTLRYKVSDTFALTGAVGYHADTDAFGSGTGYGSIDFVYRIPFGR